MWFPDSNPFFLINLLKFPGEYFFSWVLGITRQTLTVGLVNIGFQKIFLMVKSALFVFDFALVPQVLLISRKGWLVVLGLKGSSGKWSETDYIYFLKNSIHCITSPKSALLSEKGCFSKFQRHSGSRTGQSLDFFFGKIV